MHVDYMHGIIPFYITKELHSLLVDELHKQIYVRLTAPVLASFQREGSQRQSNRMLMRQRNLGVNQNVMVHNVENKGRYIKGDEKVICQNILR